MHPKGAYTHYQILYLPAIEAVIRHVTTPPRSDLNTIVAMWPRLSGAIDPKAPIWTPIDPRLEKPQRAYVAIT
jgi:hypothetical protein